MSTPNYIAIGRAVSLLQCPLHRIQAAADELGIQPSIVLNCVPYYSEDDVKRIADHLQVVRSGASRGHHDNRPGETC